MVIMSVLDLLLDPFHYTFMIRAMWVAGVVGLTCGLLSCLVTLKGWSLLGDALSHAVVPGVVVSHLLGWPFALGALIAGVLAALGIGGVRQLSGLRGDACIGVVFTAFLAFGLLLISAFPSTLSLTSVLFGNLLGIDPADALQVLVISVVAMGLLMLRWKDLLLFSFDEPQARAVGISVRSLHVLMLVLIALVTVAALQAVGAILVMALLITPGATAFLLSQRFKRMLLIAGLMGSVLPVLGAWLSFFVDASVGGVIVLLNLLAFALALLCSPQRGIWSRRTRKSVFARRVP